MKKSTRKQHSHNNLDNLPGQLTSFVGREVEIHDAKEVFNKSRSLTFIGTGGIGKTRLCLEFVYDLSKSFQDGVWFVDLSSLFEPDLVINKIYSVMGFQKEAKGADLDDLREFLHERQFLLILDSCEHLVSVCAEIVSSLLLACPNAKILATSREPLGYSGEVLFQVPPMELPKVLGQSDLEAVTGSEAVQLLVARIHTFQPEFQIDLENAPSIIQICYQLEGIPLALELVAARANFLSLNQIAAHLEDSLQLLTKGSRVSQPRQQTMEATIEWSYALLNEKEQTLFRYLAVFSGRFILEDVESIFSRVHLPTDKENPGVLHDFADIYPSFDPPEVLNLLSSLVDKSLVVVSLERYAIYKLLIPIRQFALEKLSASNELEPLKSLFLIYYLDLVEEAKVKIRGPEQLLWLERLELEYDNLRTALSWSMDSGQVENGLKLATALRDFWYRRGFIREGVEWLNRLIKADPSKNITYARALNLAGNMNFEFGNHNLGKSYTSQGLELSMSLNDKEGIADARDILGWFEHLLGNRMEGIRQFEEGLLLFRQLGDEWNIARTLLYLGDAHIRSGNYDQASILLEECLSLYREIGDKWGIAFALGNSGELARQEGNYILALKYFQEALSLHNEQGHKVDVCYLIEHVAITASELGDHSKAALLWGAANSLRESLNAPAPPSYQADYAPYVVLLRNSIGEGRFQDAWERGAILEFEQIVSEALSLKIDQSSQLPAKSLTPAEALVREYGLTERELDVLRLVAEGRTDAQVAERLYISPRTVGKHLQSIYRKLHVNSRTAAARFALDQEII